MFALTEWLHKVAKVLISVSDFFLIFLEAWYNKRIRFGYKQASSSMEIEIRCIFYLELI